MRGWRELAEDRFLSVSQGSLSEFKEIHEPCFDVCTGQLNWAGVICNRIVSLLSLGKQILIMVIIACGFRWPEMKMHCCHDDRVYCYQSS